MNSTLASIDARMSQIFTNPWLLGLLTMILMVYGSLARQTLPGFMYKLFDNRLFTLLVFIMIVYMGLKDWKVAFITALIFAVAMHNFSQKKISEAFYGGLNGEADN